MLFSSFDFIFIFLPVTCLFFKFMGGYQSSRLFILVCASAVFYYYHSFHDLMIMLLSIAFNFFLGQYVGGNKKALLFGLVCNLYILAYYKYASFFVENVCYLFNISYGVERLALPLGISFFTFQQIIYLVETYRRRLPEKNFLKYSLFVSFFPHSIAGPLVRYHEISPQLSNLKINTQNITIGGSVFIVGLFKKLIIADGLSGCVNAGYLALDNGVNLTFFEAWFVSTSYALQLYFDFSGYSEMALGLARIFNISFPLNFDTPYRSTSVIEFWRRWHITLSLFLRDYIYIPLGGSYEGIWIKHRNLLSTMLLGGLWHGASWNFVIWGLLHAMFLSINHLWRANNSINNYLNIPKKITHFLGWSLTFSSIILSWVVFRAVNLDVAVKMYLSLFGANKISLPQLLQPIFSDHPLLIYEGFFANRIFEPSHYIPFLVIGILFEFVLPSSKDYFSSYLRDNPTSDSQQEQNTNSLLMWSPTAGKAFFIALLFVFSLAVMSLSESVEFLYFNF